MGIYVEDKIFSLTTNNSLYQMKVDQYGILNHTWYGPKTDMDMSYLEDYPEISFSGTIWDARKDPNYSLNNLPLEFPLGGSDYRPAALQVRQENGSTSLDLRYDSYRFIEEYKLLGLPSSFRPSQALEITLKDEIAKVIVVLFYGVFEEENVISRAVKIINASEKSIQLEKVCSGSLDFPYGDFEIIHFHGRHAMERMVERVPLFHHTFRIDSLRGHSAHQHNPAIILAEPGTTEVQGQAYGALLLYSGNFEIEVQKDQLDQTRLTIGIESSTFSWKLTPNETFYAPEVLFSYSNQGFSRLSNQFHDLFRSHIMRSSFVQDSFGNTKERYILINNWEATYFDFTGEKLLEIAKEAHKVGIDLFVLDDGWFGKRNDDTTSLGDWQENTEKLGMSLKSLSNQIHKLPMAFGLWIEPEMVSIDSDLYRHHPDWVLNDPNYNPTLSRHQLVLDLANKEVVDYLFFTIANLIETNNLDYIKWDMNRSISSFYSQTLPPKRQQETAHRYILGLYALIDRLTQSFPHVLFEGCAGGGGRFDGGMLAYFPQFWCSDNTDAHCRAFIQHGTSFFYPMSTLGSHISDIPNHQTGRTTSFEARKVVATPGTFGYELDITKLSKEEKEKIKEQITDFKRHQPLILSGDYFRLCDPKSGVAAWQLIDKKKENILVQAIVFESRPNTKKERLILQGLEKNTFYLRKSDKKVFSSEALMHGGILLPKKLGTDIAYEEEFEKIF